MAQKRDTDDFQRIYRTPKQAGWDDADDDPEASTYHLAEVHGPQPAPDWVITSDAARQYELGTLKTGKEADVSLVERHHGDQVNVLAAKRYRKFEDRMFRNDARYRKGRRTGESRLDKAVAQGNRAGMAFRAQQWVHTEFEILGRLWSAGVRVPYPVQQRGREIMIEFIGSEHAAPRLVHAQLTAEQLPDAWDQVVEALAGMVRAGVVHGDLSPYNILWHDGQVVIIDFPQAVDPIGHPEGMALLQRDVDNVCDWFARRGLVRDASDLFAQMVSEAY